MSATVVQFKDLRLKDEVYITTGDLSHDPAKSVHGTVTGIGPGRELILDGHRQLAGFAPTVRFLVVNEEA